MKNRLPSTCQPMFATMLSMALLLFLPLMYSFHYVAATTDIPTKQEQIKATPEQDVAAVLKPFKFNPNTISEDELIQLGLPERVIKTILMFRDKGGTFRKTDDLSKIYGITDAAFEKLKPYIQL